MQIILIHPRKTGAVHLSRRSVVAAIGAALLAVAALSGGAMWLAVKQGLVPGAGLSGTSGADASVTRENLNLMAARIGEMQAQMVRLDALGARVSGLAGVPPREFDFKSQPGRGAPE